MYRVFYNNTLIADSRIEDLTIINPVVSLKVNCAGTFTFTMPSNHPYYDLIQKKVGLIKVFRDEEQIFEGDCVRTTVDFFKQKKFECEGDLTFLNDTFLRPGRVEGLTSRQVLERYIASHNALVSEEKRFTVGQVTAHDSNDSISCYTNYNSTMTEIKEDLIDDIGGFLRVRHENNIRYLDYLASSPRTNSQIIRLGENLIDLSVGLDTEELATVIIPLGETLDTQSIPGLDERLTIKTAAADSMHPAGTDYVYSQTAVSSFGWIEKVVEWNDVTEVSNLLSKGKKYLQETQFENLVIKAKAIDLGITSEELQKFRLLDMIRIISEPHGLDRYFMLSELNINLNNPEQDTVTLGIEEFNSLTAKSSSTNAAIMKQIEQMPTSNAVKSAIDNATALITGADGGYVVIERNAQGQPIEIKIQDALNNPTKIWRWNVNGLGYSNDGGETYGLAMTMDGSIIADYITSGTMTGDRVRGGTFEIGGTSLGKDGKILVKNAQGETLVTIDKNGIDFSNGETIDYSNISGVPKSIKSSEVLFYLATTDAWPQKPTAKVINTDTNAVNTWITRMPNYGNNDDYKRIFTCDQNQYTDDTYDWSTVSEYAFNAGITKITKNTITTAFVNALNVTAKYISTKDLIATGISRIGGFVINDHYIQGFNNTNYNDSTIYCELGSWNPQWEQSGYAFAVWIRNNTSEQYKLKIGIRYDGSMVSATTLDVYPTDSTYGLACHGKLYGYGDLSLEGGIYTQYNVYADRNVSGAVVDGRTGVNANAGGMYASKDIYAAGSIGCGGSKNRVVATKNYGYRNMNAYETATPYFGDIGEGTLNEDGECIIYLDDIFYECIDTDSKYQLFLQKYGQGDIWVDIRENNYFVVRGTANLKFGWEIKAIQKDYDSIRLDMPSDGITKAIIERYTED